MVTEITEPHQALSGLLIEGYGYLLSQAHSQPEARASLQRNFVLTFEEILWTDLPQSKLVNDIILWMAEEKDDFPVKLSQEITDTTRYGREFGQYTFLGNDSSFLTESPEGLARIMAWSHACPAPQRVIEEYGPEKALQRYAECNFWTGWIIEKAEKLNPSLANFLTRTIYRNPQSCGEFDPLFVPDSYTTSLPPMATPWGYALSRVLIEQFGWGKHQERTADRISTGLKLAEMAIRKSQSPPELVARLANAVVFGDGHLRNKGQASPSRVLGHILAVELEEEGLLPLLNESVKALKKHAPRLWHYYLNLTPKERASAGMIASEKINK